MKTLVYHAGALGDFVAAWPVLRQWRSEHPSSTITLLGPKEHGMLARTHGLIEDIWDLDSRRAAALFRETSSPEAMAALREFDAAMVFEAEPVFIAAVLRRAAIPRIFHQPPFPGDRTHIVKYHCDILPHKQKDTTPLIASLPLDPRCEAEARLLLPCRGPIAALHPGSGSSVKNWPLERFRTIAHLLAGSGLTVVWLRGPAEEHFEIPAEEIVLNRLSLPVLSHVLARCSLYIGNDSGVSHLAAAADCAVVALFGPSDPDVWRPLGRNVTVVRVKPPCSPCHPASDSRKSCRFSCMSTITVDKVFEACIAAMNDPCVE